MNLTTQVIPFPLYISLHIYLHLTVYITSYILKLIEEINIDIPKIPEPQQPTQQQRRPSLTRSKFDSPLQVIKELSLEDKQKSEDSDKTNSPDSSDSQRFAKVTSV